MLIEGNLVDVKRGDIYPAKIQIKKGMIQGVKEVRKKYSYYILPGLIDAHVHIESSMLCPSRFAEICIPHGTTSVISDAHEIANVAGIEGIRYMMKDSQFLRFFFAAPSCVPASSYDNSKEIDKKGIDELMGMSNVVALGEVMDYKGLLKGKKNLIEKIKSAKKYRKPIDGHAPMVTGENMKRYVSYGITTDHECVTFEEARLKQEAGMKIMIREGSSAKNLKDLQGLDYDQCFLVTDDIMVHDLVKGHMNLVIKKAIMEGIDEMKAIKMATINPARHYNLDGGSIEEGKNADFIFVKNINNMDVKKTYIAGELMAQNGYFLKRVVPKKTRSYIKIKNIKEKQFIIPSNQDNVKVNVINPIPGQIITKRSMATLPVVNGNVIPLGDIAKVAVINRRTKRVGLGFVKLGLQRGAIGSSIAHDSHHLIVAGMNDEKMACAANQIRNGGIVAVDEKIMRLSLPIAGLMSYVNGKKVARDMEKVIRYTNKMGFKGNPYTIIFFLSLLVIPDIRICDQGLFNVPAQKFMGLLVDN
jgi:adenine deaminase